MFVMFFTAVEAFLDCSVFISFLDIPLFRFPSFSEESGNQYLCFPMDTDNIHAP